MARVLVTGASGFIGGHLAERLLRRGDVVRCLARRPESVANLKSLGAEIVIGDVTRPETLDEAVCGVDAVFHVAGLTSALRRDDLWRVNRDGTTNIAAACARQPQPPIHVLVSSLAAAGPTRAGHLRQEDEPPAPVSNYGRSKLDGELATMEFADRVPTTVVRPGIVFGPRNREMLPMFATIERLRVHPQASRHSPPIALLHVDDLVNILIAAAKRGVRIAKGSVSAGSGFYFACANQYPNYAELGQMLARSLGRDGVTVLPLAGPLPWVAAGINQVMSRLRGVSDTFNLDKIREARVESWACSTLAAERDLKFNADFPLEQQLADTVLWYRDAGWLKPPKASAVEPGRSYAATTATWLPFGPQRRAGSSNH